MKHENYDILIKIQKYVKMRWDETESWNKKLTLQCDLHSRCDTERTEINGNQTDQNHRR